MSKLTEDRMPDVRTADEIVLRIMAAHWDFAACRCWVCQAGRALGLRPTEKWLGGDELAKSHPVPNFTQETT